MQTFLFTLLLLAADPLPHTLPGALGFLQGCWTGETRGVRIEENYGDTDGGSLLGTVKTVRDGKLRFFEFLRIYADDEAVWLQPYPSGRKDAPRFRLVELEPDKAAFENDTHDFPRRITYRLLPNGGLLTRVAGVVNGESRLEEYVTLPSDCGK